ncbi:DegQ family serine endoprotease [Tepidamorphus sp. 3E244]|uniref:DegQ family serine endoprotease n=1 Tax=Tepidamorphus sp. 3E244 TaxID=3385498 RepID=UPI0038FC6B6C
MHFSSRLNRTRTVIAASLAVFAAVTAFLFAAPLSAQDTRVPQSSGEMRLSFAPVVKTAAPAVVNVYATRTVQQRQRVPSIFNDPLFRRFFDAPNLGAPRERVQNALGSGVVVDSSGLIVTNHHVINGADEVRVVLADRREFAAEIVLKDDRTDLAILKIDNPPSDLPAIEFTSSDALEVGDLVLAIGNPFGVGQTVTSGIVSAVARTQAGINDMGFFIQTDAAINPGNSGGALVDMDGRLVGINTAIYSRNGGGSIGIGFAIPSEMVQLVVASAATGKTVRRPWFGGRVQAVTAEIASTIGLQRPVGVLVSRLSDKGPAARAGLAVGDVITEVDGREIADPASFSYRLATKGIGQTSQLTIIRNGKAGTLPIELAIAPEDPPRDVRIIRGSSPLLGLKVANLSPALSEEIGLDDRDKGVVVVDVARNAPAGRAGFRPGDILLSINEEEIDTTAELEKLAGSSTRLWRIRVERGGRVSQLVFGG